VVGVAPASTSAVQMRSAVASVLCCSPGAISTTPAAPAASTAAGWAAATIASVTTKRRPAAGHGARVAAPGPIHTG
jgi:hypothetical protein